MLITAVDDTKRCLDQPSVMSITCEFDLVSPDLPLTGVAAALDTVLHVEDVITVSNGPPAVVFSARDTDPKRFETCLDECASLANYVSLKSEHSKSQYRVALDKSGVDVDLYQQLVDFPTHPIEATVTERKWRVRSQFADRADLASFWEACEPTSIGFHLVRLSRPNVDDVDDYGLTEPQHEAVLVAFEMGYYGVPREATLADIAEELDTTTSALSERLRRGHHQLIERTIRATSF
ncbi:hypothetical protein DJ71_25890 [Halorubrum sp. E3]|nr:hypothetical protein DJ71_25890 [Halorubrum sp. E3]